MPSFKTYTLPPKRTHFKNKTEAERGYAREYLHLCEMEARGPLPPAHGELPQTNLDRFLIANVERVVQTAPKKFELRGMYDARIAEYDDYFQGYFMQILEKIYRGGYELPPIEYLAD